MALYDVYCDKEGFIKCDHKSNDKLSLKMTKDEARVFIKQAENIEDFQVQTLIEQVKEVLPPL